MRGRQIGMELAEGIGDERRVGFEDCGDDFLVLPPRNRAGRIDERAAGRERSRSASQYASLKIGEARWVLRILSPAGVGTRGERSQVRARRIHENAIVATAEVGLGRVTI